MTYTKIEELAAEARAFLLSTGANANLDEFEHAVLELVKYRHRMEQLQARIERRATRSASLQPGQKEER